MYSPDYLIFFGIHHLPEKFHEIIRKLAYDVIPSSGVLHYSIGEIASKLNCSEKEVETLIYFLFEISPCIISRIDGNLVFDFLPDEVNKLRHYRNAMSNMANFDDEIF